LQHWTGVDGNSHLCIKGHYTKKGFFAFEDPLIKLLYFVQYCTNTVYFSPLQVKINHAKELHVRLFLGLLAWLQTGLFMKSISKNVVRYILCTAASPRGFCRFWSLGVSAKQRSLQGCPVPIPANQKIYRN
jgi:hypothetical protein